MKLKVMHVNTGKITVELAHACRSCSNSVVTCAGAPSCSHLRTLAEALRISVSLKVRSSSLRTVPPSTAMLGRTAGGGTGITVRIIQSGRANSSFNPSNEMSVVGIFLSTLKHSEAVKRRFSGCVDLTS